MTTVSLAPGAADSVTEWIHETAREQVGKWFQGCDRLLKACHARCVAARASSREEQQFERGLKWFMRSARLMLAQANDPDFQDRETRKGIDNRLLWLEEYLGYLQNPLSSAESGKLLAEIFPE